jgi:hypothetical protein
LTGTINPSGGARPTGSAGVQRAITATSPPRSINIPSSPVGTEQLAFSSKVADKEAGSG